MEPTDEQTGALQALRDALRDDGGTACSDSGHSRAATLLLDLVFADLDTWERERTLRLLKEAGYDLPTGIAERLKRAAKRQARKCARQGQ